MVVALAVIALIGWRVFRAQAGGGKLALATPAMRCIDANGKAVTGVVARFWAPDKVAGKHLAFAKSDDEGRIEPPTEVLATGFYCIAHDENGCVTQCYLEPGDKPDIATLHFTGVEDIRGHVQDEQGHPIAGAEIEARFSGGPVIEATTSDETGLFLLQSISKDLAFLSVTAIAKGYAPASKEWSRKTEERIGLTLAKARTLRVRLVDDRDRPLPGLEVKIKGRPDLTKTSDVQGYVVYEEIAADLALWPRVTHPTLTHRREAIFADAPERILRMETPASLEGRVVNGLGHRMSGVEIRHSHGPRAWVRTTSIRGGRFAIGDLPSGRVVLHYETARGELGSVEVDIKRGEKRRDFILRINAQ